MAVSTLEREFECQTKIVLVLGYVKLLLFCFVFFFFPITNYII